MERALRAWLARKKRGTAVEDAVRRILLGLAECAMNKTGLPRRRALRGVAKELAALEQALGACQ